MNRDFKKLLYLSNYPPCSLGGASIIAKQLLHRYDMERLHVVCDSSWLRDARRKGEGSGLLDCPHHAISDRLPVDLRPRRLWVKVRSILNLSRVKSICRVAEKIIEEEDVEAIFAPLYFPEFAIAALRLHQSLGIPLFVFETDDWEEIHKDIPIVARRVRRHHREILESASKVWMTSPGMIRHNREKFGVTGDFLFHFIDASRYQVEDPRPSIRETWDLVYTGAINTMFADAMLKISGWINEGIQIAHRQVRLRLYTGSDPSPYLGPNVIYEGFVAHDEIPRALASGDAFLVAVSFSNDPMISRMVRTSLYTKTVDYLAAARPILLISPEYTAEHDYFSEVTHAVEELSLKSVRAGMRKLLNDSMYRDVLVEKGLDFVKKHHSFDAMEEAFLAHFRNV